VIFGWATREEIKEMKTLALKVNDLLRAFFEERNVVLVDFKLEFGRTEEGEMVVADEISPDTCRFWDTSSRNSLDKDRFRKDLGNVLEAYEEIKRRICAGERK
jgi:phosphoribosylaminoimidazole-succinocarboxamide synthase